MLPVLPPFLFGLVMAPFVKRMVKPLARGILQTSVNLGVEIKRAAQEAGEELQDLAAEATAEMFAAELRDPDLAEQPTEAPKAHAAAGGKKN